jgi:hypothetical protein
MYTQAVQDLSSNETWLQKSVATKPYVKTSRMSNQQKDEFIGNRFFVYEISGEVMAKFHQKTYFKQEGMICQKYWFKNWSSFRLP